MSREKKRAPIVLPPGAGRAYEMGPVHAVFKADGDETRGRYSISEWWLEPYTRGPGAHTHEEDDVFFVIEGTMSFFVDGAWIDAPKGSLVIAPGGTAHDFENRTAERAGALNLSVPGDFEPHMAGIAEWFRARSAAASRTANVPRRFGIVARERMAAFRETLSPGARSPEDEKGTRHGHLLAHGYEEENLMPELRGESGARKFFRDRGIKWWTNARSGDRPTGNGYQGPTRNLASSQVSCVNFLLPLASIDGALREFVRAIDDDVEEVETIVDQAGRRSPVELEWVGWDAPLEGGAISRGANQTSVDALIVARTSRGRRVYLLEWKYCEEYLCPEDKGFGSSGTTRRSRYGSLFSASDSPFRADAVLDELLFEPFYQIMRMHLLAAKMIQSGVTPSLPIEEARVVVVCPEANTDYRMVVPDLPLAKRFPDLVEVQSMVRANLWKPEQFCVVGQERIVAHLRRAMPELLRDWLAYHQARYGW